MPITEAPTSPPSRPPEPPPKRRKGSNYDEMEAHELLIVIDELEDERSKLRRREGIWVSVLAHILIFAAIALLPRYMPQVHVVDQSDLLKHQKDMTLMDLPPNALKAPRTRTTPLPASKMPDAQQPRAPRIDRKTLEELKQQARAQPPPVPQPPQQEPPQEAAQQPRPQPAPAPPLPTVQQSQVDAPRPAATAPRLNTGNQTAGEAVRDAARNAAKSGIQMGGGGGLGAPGRGQNQGLQVGPEVLTDTGDWNPHAYIQRIIFDTHKAWDPIIPAEVGPPLSKRGIVGI